MFGTTIEPWQVRQNQTVTGQASVAVTPETRDVLNELKREGGFHSIDQTIRWMAYQIGNR